MKALLLAAAWFGSAADVPRAWVPAACDQERASVKALRDRLYDRDERVIEGLFAAADHACPEVQVEALFALTDVHLVTTPERFEREYSPRIEALIERTSKTDLRGVSGHLSQGLQVWRETRSPAALRRAQGHSQRETLKGVLALLAPLLFLLAAGAAGLAQRRMGVLGAVLLASSEEVAGTITRLSRVLLSRPRLALLLPAFAAALTGAASCFGDGILERTAAFQTAPELSLGQAGLLLTGVGAAAALLAVIGAFVTSAVIARCFVQSLRGRSFSVLAAAAAALARLPHLLPLAFRGLRGSAALADAALEATVLLSNQIPPAQARSWGEKIIAPQAGRAKSSPLRSVSIRFLVFVFAGSLPLVVAAAYGYIADDLDPRGLAPSLRTTTLFSVFIAAFYLALVEALHAVGAAAAYVYATDAKLATGIERRDVGI